LRSARGAGSSIVVDVVGASLAGGVTVVVVLGSGVVVVVVVVLDDGVVVVVELSAGAVVVDGVVIVPDGCVVCSVCARSGPEVVLGGDSLLVCAYARPIEATSAAAATPEVRVFLLMFVLLELIGTRPTTWPAECKGNGWLVCCL
jgi:hypothetical protein